MASSAVEAVWHRCSPENNSESTSRKVWSSSTISSEAITVLRLPSSGCRGRGLRRRNRATYSRAGAGGKGRPPLEGTPVAYQVNEVSYHCRKGHALGKPVSAE